MPVSSWGDRHPLIWFWLLEPKNFGKSTCNFGFAESPHQHAMICPIANFPSSRPSAPLAFCPSQSSHLQTPAPWPGLATLRSLMRAGTYCSRAPIPNPSPADDSPSGCPGWPQRAAHSHKLPIPSSVLVLGILIGLCAQVSVPEIPMY